MLTRCPTLDPEEKMDSTPLSRRTVVSVDGPAAGVAIACDSGAAWITQCCDATDYVLTAGKEFAAQSGGRIVIQIVRDGMISIRLRDPSPGGRTCDSSTNGPGSLRAWLGRWGRSLINR